MYVYRDKLHVILATANRTTNLYISPTTYIIADRVIGVFLIEGKKLGLLEGRLREKEIIKWRPLNLEAILDYDQYELYIYLSSSFHRFQ